MEGSAIAPPKQVTQKSYLIVTAILGIVGAFVAMTGFSAHVYRVGPLLMEMKITPATEGTTELGIEFAQLGLKAGTVKTRTHTGFLGLKGTVVGVIGTTSAVDAVAGTQDPATLAKLVQTEGKDATRRFLIRLALIVLAGGASGGAAIALVGLRPRRIFQGALAGVLVVGLLGLIAWQTYDIEKFNGVKFGAPTVASADR